MHMWAAQRSEPLEGIDLDQVCRLCDPATACTPQQFARTCEPDRASDAARASTSLLLPWLMACVKAWAATVLLSAAAATAAGSTGGECRHAVVLRA